MDIDPYDWVLSSFDRLVYWIHLHCIGVRKYCSLPLDDRFTLNADFLRDPAVDSWGNVLCGLLLVLNRCHEKQLPKLPQDQDSKRPETLVDESQIIHDRDGGSAREINTMIFKS